MSVDIATLGIKVDSRDVRKADSDLDQLAARGKKAEKATQQLTNAFGGLRGALAALGLGAVVYQAVQMADTWKNVQGRLSLVTSGTGELASVTDKLFAVSNRTRNGFEATADLYANLARTTKQLGANQNQLLQVTESISQALIVSGATASGSEAALRQLGQAFASGALRGDELNSIMENTPRIAAAIADGMGITIGQLRKLGKEGKLTGDAIFNALLSQKEVLEQEFARMPVTVGQSLVVLRNELMKYVGDSDNMTGATTALAGAITGFSKTLDVVIPAIALLATALGVGFVRNAIAARLAATAATSTIAAMGVAARTAGAALLGAFGGPVGVAITAVGAALAYTYGETVRSNQAIGDLESVTKTANVELEVAIARAEKAGVNVASLGLAADLSAPQIQGIADKYNNAASAAKRLAFEAKEAARAVAQAAIADLQSKRSAALGPLEAKDEGTAALMANPWMPQPLTTLRRGIATTRQGLGWLMGGQSEKQRRQSAGVYDNAISAQRDILKSIDATPAQAFVDTPLNSVGGGESDKKKGRSGGKSEAEKAVDEATRFAEALEQQTATMGMAESATKEYEAAQIAASIPAGALRDRVLAAAEAYSIATFNVEAHTGAMEALAEVEANRVRDNQASLEAGKKMADQLEFDNSLLGMNAKERAIAIAVRDMETAGIIKGTDGYIQYADAILKAAEAKGQLELNVDNAREYADAMNDVADTIANLTEGFGELFGTAGAGFENLMNTIGEYGAREAELREQIEQATMRGAMGDAERARATEELGRLSVAKYGDMLGAAKTFFKEGSTGFKVLEGAEKAYRLFQFAMQVKAMVMDTLFTGTSVANSGVRASANGVEAVSKAMASLPPPLNFIAAGAVVAFLVAMGVKMVGGGGGGKGAASAAAKATAPTYSGPVDEYGAPTSGYSVLKPGSTTVANDNISPNARGNASNVGSSISIGDTVLQINGNADNTTIEQAQRMLDANRKQTVLEARQAVAADMAARASRQNIGGGM